MEQEGFKILNGIFKGYSGPTVTTLIIPEGVTKIEDGSLRFSNLKGCKKLYFRVV